MIRSIQILVWMFTNFVMIGQIQIHPDQINGVKWKSDNLESSGSDNAVSPDYEYGNLSRRNAVLAMNDQKINAVVLRHNEPSRILDFEHNWTQIDFDTATIQLIKEIQLYSPNTSAYIWKRQWFNNGQNQVNAFVDVMVNFITMAQTKGCDATLAGICPIETHLKNSKETLATALWVAREINAKTNGWLKNKTFFWPGAGMGQWFKDIDDGGETFFKDMAAECGTFAFIFKYMQSQPSNAEIHQNDLYNTLTKAGTPSQLKSFMNEVLGLSDLSLYIAENKQKYPNHANVMFWGDNGDGLNSFMNDKAILVTHQILVEDNNWSGCFFNLVMANVDANATRRDKTILLDHNGVVYPNGEVYETWRNWGKSMNNSVLNGEFAHCFVYPIPAVAQVNVDMDVEGKRQISVYDMTGRNLFLVSTHEKSYSFGVNDWQNGNYVLVVESEYYKATFLFQVEHTR